MTEGSTLGSMTLPAPDADPKAGSALKLWTQLAWGRPEFGRPETFFSHVEESKWISFTVTLQGSRFVDRVVGLTGNTPGEGGLVTFKTSNWLMSIVIPHQPHVIGQPSEVTVFWGYGLYVDRLGNFVDKAMSDCSGADIMLEVLGHLGCADEREVLLDRCICIPCKLPFITSQFLPRAAGDRPEVRPRGSQNIALMGQFCELADDVVFTVEYSIRSARAAVVEMLGLEDSAPPMYSGLHTPRVLYEALRTLHDIPA
jgi:oleate hydratase